MRVQRRPARVLYCESSADGTIGGSHYCLLYLLEHLDRGEFEPLTVFYEEHALIERFRRVSTTIVHPQDMPTRWGANGVLATARRTINLGKFLRTVAGHVRFLRHHEIALIHLNNSITRHQDWMLAAQMARVPCIVHERGLSDVYTARDRAYARRVALIIPMSAWIRDHMVARGVPGDNIRVMYDGLDPDRLHVTVSPEDVRQAWDIPPGARVIGIVGNIRPWKGQETVVRAVVELTTRWPTLVCLFVGATTPADEGYKARLDALISEHGIGSNVRFTGYQRDVANLINIMECVVHASILPEPFGMVVLEAMARRKAVIGSGAGGPTESVVEGRTGFTYAPGDSSALAARIAELLADPARCRSMGEAGYQRLLEAFTMQQYMRNIHEAYRAVLASRPLPADVGLPAPGVSPLRDSL